MNHFHTVEQGETDMQEQNHHARKRDLSMDRKSFLKPFTVALAALLLPVALVAQAHAGVLVSYLDNDITSSSAAAAPNQLDSVSVSATNLVITGMGSPTDVGTSTSFDDMYMKGSQIPNTTLDAGKYVTFSVTAQNNLQLGRLSFDLGVRYSKATLSTYTTNYIVRSSTDGFTTHTDLGTDSITVDYGGAGGSDPYYLVPLHAVLDFSQTLTSGNSVEFRFYFFDNSGSGDVGTRLDDVVLETVVVPEPASLALLGLSGLMLAGNRRRK